MSTESIVEGARPYGAAPKVGLGTSLRIVGMAIRGEHNVRAIQEEYYARVGPVLRQRVGVFNFVNLLGPDANRLVLMNRSGIFSNEKSWNLILKDIFPNGLMLKDGTDHRYHRKIMQQAFTPPVLRAYAERMRPMVESGIANWESGDGTRLMFRSFKELTLEMAASIFMGEELGEETRAVNSAFEQMVAASVSLLRFKSKHFEYGKGILGRKVFVKFLGDRIAGKRSGDAADMFSRLCHAASEEGDTFTNEEVVDHMVFLMMAAHDTTTSTLTSMSYLLAKNPEWQERLRAECLALGEDAVDFDAQEGLKEMSPLMPATANSVMVRRRPGSCDNVVCLLACFRPCTRLQYEW